MSAEQHQERVQRDELGFERLVFFSDAIFSVAITLMALEIRLPDLDPKATADQVNAAILTIVPHLFVYVLSYAVIGTYWMLHRRLFRTIKHYNLPLIWLNLIFLMFIALIPVATDPLGTYPNFPVISALYAAEMALVGFSEFALWWYAVSRHFTIPFSSPRIGLYMGLRILTAPIVFFLSIFLLPFGNYSMIQLSWLLIIPLRLGLERIFPQERVERASFEDGEV